MQTQRTELNSNEQNIFEGIDVYSKSWRYPY